jgi:hypothetical protein
MLLALENVRALYDIRLTHHKAIFENNSPTRIAIRLAYGGEIGHYLLDPGECLLPIELTIDTFIR